MFQYISKLKYWFINLLFNKNKPKDEKYDNSLNTENNEESKINVISCKIRYIKENKLEDNKTEN